MFFIQQPDEHECGFTALKIMLANIHQDDNYLFLVSHFKEENVSFYSLIIEAEKYQTSLVGLKAERKEDLVNYQGKPFIASTIIDNMHHAVYVYKVNKKYVYYFDPAKGKKKLTHEDFDLIWTGELIGLKEYKKTKCPIKKPNFLKKCESIISLIIELISVVSAILGVYFISKDSYIFLPIIFFTLMILSEIFLKKYSLIVMKHIDKRIEEVITDIKDKKYFDFYKDYEVYKKYLLMNQLNTFSSFAIFLVISIVFIINDKMNFIYILINLLLAFTNYLFIHPLLKSEESEIKELEEAIKNKEEKVEAFTFMNLARNKAYKFIDKLYAYKYVVITIEIALSFILMIYHELVSVSYMFFYTALEFYLYSNVLHLLTEKDNYSIQDNLLNKLLHNIEKNSLNDY